MDREAALAALRSAASVLAAWRATPGAMVAIVRSSMASTTASQRRVPRESRTVRLGSLANGERDDRDAIDSQTGPSRGRASPTAPCAIKMRPRFARIFLPVFSSAARSAGSSGSRTSDTPTTCRSDGETIETTRAAARLKTSGDPELTWNPVCFPATPMVDPATRRKLESEAEVLAASQLDLLAQIEAQLRAVHHLMRRIEPLRARSGGQPSEAMTNGERADTLTGLSGDLEAIEQQLSVQWGCCEDMLATIAQMRQRLPALKQAAGLIEQTELSSQDDTDT